MTTLQVRLRNDDEKASFERMRSWLTERQAPGLDAPDASAVLRAALRIATAGTLMCPHCDSALVERSADDGGTLGVWVCPECSAGNGKVIIET